MPEPASHLGQSRDALTTDQRALLALGGFEWNDAHGVWIDRDGARIDTAEEALNEVYAMADLDWIAQDPADA